MAHFLYAIACAFVLFLCVEQGYSINCWQCNSHNDTECLKNVPPEKYMKPCNSTYTLCRKIKQVIDFEVNGLQPETRVIRSCAYVPTNTTTKCYQRSGFGGRQEVCGCDDKDYCNTSSSLIGSSTLLLAAFYTLLKICH